jgi:LPXTG-motif cell wall-anchored protein
MFRQLTRRHIAALAIGITTMAVVGGMELPADAHTAQVLTTDAHCIAPGAWAFTLTVAPTNLDANPAATIVNSAGPYTVHTFPYHTSFTQQTSHATVAVNIVWADGVTYSSGPLTVQAPPGGCEPITVPTQPTTPPTTTCAAAVPPRTDCGVPPVTTVPPVATTVVNTSPPVSVSPPATVPTTPAPVVHASGPVERASSSTVAVLPHTGAGDTVAIFLIVGLLSFLSGFVLVYVVARSRP